MTRTLRFRWLAAASMVVLPAVVGADAEGALSGTVSAPDGARLPGSVLTLTRPPQPGVVATAASGEGGVYRVSGLAPGLYEVRVEAPAFAPRTVANVDVEAATTRVLDLVLDLAVVREAVTVLGLAPRDSLEAAAIREGGARDVGEALDGMPGVVKLRKGAIANDLVLRGFQSRDLNVVIDGQRVYGACPNHMDPPSFHVDFSEVERIEVAKGPFDLRNQGSLGGLVNMVTRRPAEGAHLDASLTGGSFGQVSPSLGASYGGSRVSALVGASYRRSDPYEGGSGRLFTDVANYRPEAFASDAYRAATGWGRVSVQPADGHRLELAYTRQEADHVLYPYLAMDALTDDTDRVHLDYEATGLSDELKALRAQAYFTRVDHWMSDELRVSSLAMPRAYSMGTSATTHTAGGKVEANLRSVALGLEAYRRGWDAATEMAGMKYVPQASVPDVTVESVGAYAEGWRTVGSVTFTAGARLDNVRSRADEQKANTNLYFAYNDTRSLSRTDTVPSGKLRLSWPAARGLELSAGFGRTARVAEANERFFALQRAGSDWVGNPGLQPARNTGVDAVVSLDRTGVHLEASGYVNWVDGFIIIREAPRLHMVSGIMNARARSYANVDARLLGGELQAVLNAVGRVFFYTRLSYVRGTQEPRPDLGITSHDLAEMPPLAGRVGVRFDDGRCFILAEGLFTDAQDKVDADLGETRTAGYATANLRAGYRRGRLALAVGVDNLFDRSYVEHLSYQRDPFRTGVRVEAPGRSVYANASVRF